MNDDPTTTLLNRREAGASCETVALADGRLGHWPSFCAPDDAGVLYDCLRSTVPWEQMTFRERTEPRLTAWMGDFNYRYSGIARRSMLRCLIRKVEQAVFDDTLGHFDGVLLNYYRTGADKIGLHADAEPDLLVDGPIASLSFGATRRFILRHNQTREKVVLPLTSGSLLVMEGTTQRFWKHEIPAEPRCDRGRINLTMRVHARR